MRISLIMATCGRSDELRPCLESLCAQRLPPFEVLVMDQNADERLGPLIEEYRRRGLALSHHRMLQPSLSMARNRGMELARGELIGFPDDDCWYEADTLEQLHAAATAHPDATGYVGVWVEQQATGLPASKDYARDRLDARAWRRFQGGPASSISLFMRRRALLELQGFDPRLGVGQWYGAGEETDLIMRALAQGHVMLRVRQVRVHHAWGQTVDALERLRSRARGGGALYAKHGMPGWVIMRGLLSPLLDVGRRRQTLRAALSIAWGRLEGWWRWRREQAARFMDPSIDRRVP